MKAVILAGGFGTRLSEETNLIPKPMVEIGGQPILWHIMQIYSHYGIDDFVICAGYKAKEIKKFFLEYAASLSDFTINLRTQEVQILSHKAENWKVTVIDTGLETMTGGRIKRIISYISSNEPFCLTYGDGLSDVNIGRLIEFHKSHNKMVTVTAVTPPGRFGVLDVQNNNQVVGFREKIASDQYRINGGFFVLDPKVANFIHGDKSIWEEDPMQQLAADGQIMAWNHDGFWQSMDTLREKNILEKLWQTGNAPWLRTTTDR